MGEQPSPELVPENGFWLYKVIRGLRPVHSLLWKFRLVGELDAIPREGPLLLAANHACFLDPWLMCIIFPREIHFLVTRKWFYKSRFWERFFRAQGCIPVHDSPETTMDMVCQLMRDGEVVGVFPEGRISNDGRMQKFQAGISYFAARSGAPVLPIGITGAYESLPRNRRVPRPGPITLRVGRPLHFPDAPWTGRPPTRSVAEFRTRVYRAVAELCGQSKRDGAAGPARPADAVPATPATADQDSSISSTP